MVWSRTVDNAGQPQAVIANAPRFFVSGIAQSFSIAVSSDPSTSGNDITVTVTARDGLGGSGGVSSSYAGTVHFLVDAPNGPETDDTDAIMDNLHGLPQDYPFLTGTGGDNGVHVFPIRLRKAGARILRVQQSDNPSLFGSLNLTVLRNVADRVQIVSDYDPAGQQPGPGVTTPGSEGRLGAPRTRIAGQVVTYLAQVTDQFYNLYVDSTATINMVDSDPNNDTYGGGADASVVVPGSTTFTRTFVSADTVGQTMVGTGAGIYPNASNPGTPVPVTGQPADRIIALLPGEVRQQGKIVAPFGKSGTPDEVQAGSTYTVKAYATDGFYNDDLSVAFAATAKLYTDSYTGSQTQLLQSGTTTFTFRPVVFGTHSFQVQSAALPSGTSNYYTPTPFQVWWSSPTKIQMLVAGQLADPGRPPYDANPTTGGRKTAAAQLTAGNTTTITINLVDDYYNVTQCTTPFITQISSFQMPLVQLDFMNDPNIQGRLLAPNPFQKTLVNGTTGFSFIPVTRNAGLTLRAKDTNATGTYYSTDTVSGIVVVSSTPLNLLAQLPGETYAEGTKAGKTGLPDVIVARDPYTVTVRAVDLYNNKANDGRQVRFSVNDPYAVVPPPQSLALGQTAFAGFIPSVATGNLVVNAQDDDVLTPAFATLTSTGLNVIPGTADRLMVVLAGETLVPGKTVAPFGVTGTPAISTAGVYFNANIYATDSR